jgi:polyisoprenoid-binding protein YceI
MNARPIICILCSLVSLAAAPAPAARAADYYFVDPAHLSVLFGVNHANLSYVYGFFRKAQGVYMLDKANPANCRFHFSIDVNSVDTNHEERDAHLKSRDFFEVERYPKLEFISRKCELANTADGSIVYNVTGDMTLHGVTRQVTLPMRMLAEGKGPFNDHRTGFLCQFDIRRSQFGMNNVLNVVGDQVAITISFEGKRQEEAAAATQPQPPRQP